MILSLYNGLFKAYTYVAPHELDGSVVHFELHWLSSALVAWLKFGLLPQKHCLFPTVSKFRNVAPIVQSNSHLRPEFNTTIRETTPTAPIGTVLRRHGNCAKLCIAQDAHMRIVVASEIFRCGIVCRLGTQIECRDEEQRGHPSPNVLRGRHGVLFLLKIYDEQNRNS